MIGAGAHPPGSLRLPARLRHLRRRFRRPGAKIRHDECPRDKTASEAGQAIPPPDRRRRAARSACAARRVRAAGDRAADPASAGPRGRRGAASAGQRLGGGAESGRRCRSPIRANWRTSGSSPRGARSPTAAPISWRSPGARASTRCWSASSACASMPDTRCGRLGYWVGRRFWGHGVATEAAGRLARWALANLDLDRLEAGVITDNPASAAVLRRIGFRADRRGDRAVPRPRRRACRSGASRRRATTSSAMPSRRAAGRQQAAAAGRRLRADRCRWPRAAGAPAGGQEDGRAVGIPRRQAAPGRDAGGRADPRAEGGAGHRRLRRLPGAVRLRLARVRAVPSADAAVSVPPLEGHADGRGRTRRWPGCGRRSSPTIRCRRPTSR